MSELKPCPHCGGKPYFSSVEEKDDRRYMQIELTCCATLTQSIGWGSYKSMSEAEIKNYLTDGVVEQWNNRIDSNELAASQAREAELQKLLDSEIQAHGATITREAQLSLKLEAAEARIAQSPESDIDQATRLIGLRVTDNDGRN